jgi:hypothetical protein
MSIPELSTMQSFDRPQVSVLRRILQYLHKRAFDATGDTVTGDVVIEGDLTVNGTIAPGISAGLGGWTDDGVVVRLTTVSDRVGVGTSTPSASYKMEIIGNLRASGTIQSGSTIVIDGNLGKITSTTGTIDFENENLITTGNIGGVEASFGGFMNMDGIAAPALSAAGEGRIYFDSTSNNFQVSEDAGAYVPLFGGVTTEQKRFSFLMGT